MMEVILIIILLSTPVILSLLYFIQSDNKDKWFVYLPIKYIRKFVCFVLKCLSLLLVGDTKFVNEIEKDVEKD